VRRKAIGAPWALWLLLPGFFPGVAKSELLYFAKGGRAQLRAKVDGEIVRLETPAGLFEFRGDDFRAIVPGSWPESEWEARRKSALAGGAPARFEAAWWALENGLVTPAEAMLRAAVAADPAHQPSARMVAALDRLARPCKDPPLDPLRQALGGTFEVARGPHIVLFHQHTAEEAEERISVLEGVVKAYYLLFAAQGVELWIPGRRMASAWFADQRDYRAFLSAQHAGAFLSTRGYYHPTLNAVAAYDARSAGPEKAAREAVGARAAELDRMTAAVDRMTPKARLRITFPDEPTRTLNKSEARDLLRRLTRDLDRQRLLAELSRRSVDLGTAAHEMVHQLVSTSGLVAHHSDFPTWLHEGFAAQFEVIRGGRWAGIGRAHDLRLPDWREIKPRPRLTPLLRDEGLGRGYRRDLYAASWGLVYYLRKRHPQQFLSYLDLLRNPGLDATPGEDRALSAFRAAFSQPSEELEADWHRFLDELKTPLELSEPPGRSSHPKGPS
jgi:hypothetical protein